MRTTLRLLLCSFLVVFLVGAVSAVRAQPFSLEDDNSSITIWPAFGGAYEWQVDEMNHLFEQGFWYRVGPTGGESSVSGLTIAVEGATDSDFDGNLDTAYVKYVDALFDLEIRYSLDGGALGSNGATLAEQITITNTAGPCGLDFHFFQYSDFDLNGTPFDDTARLEYPNLVSQTDPFIVFNETVVTPRPNYWEIADWGTTIASLLDLDPTTLSNGTSPLGPGDVTWAFQWDFRIPQGSSVQIGKVKRLAPVPEPATMLLFGAGLIGLAAAGRKKFSKKA